MNPKEKLLRDKIEFLEEENLQLRERLEPKIYTPSDWFLTKTEEKVFKLLLVHPVITKDFIYSSLYRDEGIVPGIKVIDVYICRLRRKLVHRGVHIDTVRERGYSLRDRQKWKALLKDFASGSVNTIERFNPFDSVGKEAPDDDRMFQSTSTTHLSCLN